MVENLMPNVKWTNHLPDMGQLSLVVWPKSVVGVPVVEDIYGFTIPRKCVVAATSRPGCLGLGVATKHPVRPAVGPNRDALDFGVVLFPRQGAPLGSPGRAMLALQWAA
jgi:hypothetical protein